MRFINTKKEKSADRSEIWESYKKDESEKSRETLIMEYLHLVKYAAGRVAVSLPNYIEIDDLFAAGLLGLIQAIEKYDMTRMTKFETYAIPRIRGAMLDELRNQDWFPRSIRHKAKLLESVLADLEMKLGRPATDLDVVKHLKISMEEYYKLLNDVSLTSLISLDQGISSVQEGLYSVIGNSLPHANAVDPYEKLEEKELLEIVKETLTGLPEKERLVMTLYYYEELTLKEIGKILQVSESRVCQIHTKAMLRLKGRINRMMSGMTEKAAPAESASAPQATKEKKKAPPEKLKLVK
ncbi:MAG: FliA/WhiG family RNA polymerase sigma factor [Candidatus Krumholzibacteriota bacterium]|nr:FliA/WhiG family RNA polymerase sigma factor [Candidatus Krumholzibacteriota bacterium]